jgi:hypothetical protein
MKGSLKSPGERAVSVMVQAELFHSHRIAGEEGGILVLTKVNSPATRMVNTNGESAAAFSLRGNQ